MTSHQYGEIHDRWLAAVPVQRCGQCGQPMKIEDLTSQHCSRCNRGLLHSVFCRHCGTEMDEEDFGYDRDMETEVSTFTCPSCGAKAHTAFYEGPGHVVWDEELVHEALEDEFTE